MRDIFDLRFSSADGESDAIAIMTCGQLDAVLHKSTPITVRFESGGGAANDGSVKIESFQIQSLLSYLKNQEYVRNVAESELSRARAAWLRLDSENIHEMWSDSTFAELWLPCLMHDHYDGGGGETLSMYIIVFRTDWDEEHVRRTLKFRDDKFISLGVDGE